MLSQTQKSKNLTAKQKKPHKEDIYEGQMDSKTKERHGKGVYHFPNRYFEYEGQYVNNVRNGPGVLKLANGTKIQAIFVNGEIQGEVKVSYADGSKYVGHMIEGQRSGQGSFTSEFQKYVGQWKENKKHGTGEHHTTSYDAKGQFKNNKLDGQATITTWDSQYIGSFKQGKKHGQGKLIDKSNQIEYDGMFEQDKYGGMGRLTFTDSNFTYNGQFKQGQATLKANEFEFRISFLKNDGGQLKAQQPVVSKAFEYELEGDPFTIEVRSCYQGPMQLDEVQPTQQEIDKMVKAWQEQNKKVKNPPPMPDFSEPRMKKPALRVVQPQSGRKIKLQLLQVAEGKEDKVLPIDWREAILKRRAQIQVLKAQQAKKNEEQADKKKPGKKDGKGAPEAQFKVNIYKEDVPAKQKQIIVRNQNGLAAISKIELPDDFPPGKYLLLVSNHGKQYVGQIEPLRIDFTVNAKGTAAGKQPKKK